MASYMHCPVCQSVFQPPIHILPCGHSFCLGCIQDLPRVMQNRREVVQCPCCHLSHIIPDAGFSGFIRNFQLETMLNNPQHFGLEDQPTPPANKKPKLEDDASSAECSHCAKVVPMSELYMSCGIDDSVLCSRCVLRLNKSDDVKEYKEAIETKVVRFRAELADVVTTFEGVSGVIQDFHEFDEKAASVPLPELTKMRNRLEAVKESLMAVLNMNETKNYIFLSPSKECKMPLFYHPTQNAVPPVHGWIASCHNQAVCVLEDCVYLIGGRDMALARHTVCVHVYTKSTGQFSALPPLPRMVGNASACGYGSDLILIGGRAGSKDDTFTEECLRYSFEDRQWYDFPPLTIERGIGSSVVVGEEMFTFGGWDGKNRLNSFEIYSPATEKWEVHRTIMPIALCGHSTAVLDEVIYLCGGWVKGVSRRECYKFNLVSKQFDPIAPMNAARSNFGLVGFEGRLVALGGRQDGGEPLASVEEYDPKANQWRFIKSLNQPRVWFNAAVI